MHVLIMPSERYLPKDDPLQGIFQQDQAHALKRHGYKVGVIAPPELRSIRLLIKKHSKWPVGKIIGDDQGIPVYNYHGWSWIPHRFQSQLLLWLRAGKILFKNYIKQHGKPDIIHAHNARNAGFLASKIKKRWNIPYVLTEHSSTYAREPIHSSEVSYIEEAFKNADKRLVVSPRLGNTLERVVGNSVCPWEWVPNIVDCKFTSNIQLRKKEHGKKPVRFLNVGSLIEIKGQDDLLQAFASKFTGKIDVQLRIGGDGILRRKLEILSERLRVDKQVTFLGKLTREQVLMEMQSCDVYVHSSHYETFGVVLIEALSCGKPVVSTACGGPECIVCDQNGKLVSPGDIISLGKAMEDVLVNIDSYEANWIRNDCIARFGEQAVVDQLSSIYQEITQGNKI